MSPMIEGSRSPTDLEVILILILLLLANRIPGLQSCASDAEKAKNAKCDEFGKTGHFKRCYKKLDNFPNDNSNPQNSSP